MWIRGLVSRLPALARAAVGLITFRRGNAQASKGGSFDVDPIDVQRHLVGLDYPARKDEVIAKAEQNGAPQEVIEALQALAEEQFDDRSEVQAALG